MSHGVGGWACLSPVPVNPSLRRVRPSAYSKSIRPTAGPGRHSGVPHRHRPPPKAGSDADFVNRAEWLRDDDAPASTRTRTRTLSGGEQSDSDALLRHFKEGVARSLGGDGRGSHYDLGVARKGMGLLDDAIEEFRKALGSRSHRLPVSEALGQDFVEQERYQVAATVLSRALREPGGGRTKGRCALSSRIFMRRPAALGRGS